MDNNREAFEAWAEVHSYYLDKDSEGKYVKNTTGMAWQIWRAAKKTPPLDFSKSQIGNYAAEEVIRTMWANGMESEAQSLADCFYGLVDANAALASQAQNDPLDTAGNRHPQMRYAGYKGQPLAMQNCTADEIDAYDEGVRASKRYESQAQQPAEAKPYGYAVEEADGEVKFFSTFDRPAESYAFKVKTRKVVPLYVASQAQQEPIAWLVRERSKRTGLLSNEILVENKNHFRDSENFKYEFVPLYTIPPAPEGEKS